MISSAEIIILMKVAELAKRYGLKASEADAYIGHNGDLDNDFKFFISFPSPGYPPEKFENFRRFEKALGVEDKGTQVWANDLKDLEDIVDRAITHAPRARSL